MGETGLRRALVGRVRSRAFPRAEVAFVVLLIAVVAFLPRGLPVGIVGLGVVTGSVLGLHAMGIVLLYSRTRILSFAQFGLGAAASVLFFLWVQYNQFAVLANSACFGCLAPEGATIGSLQHNPDPFREYLLEHHPWVLVVNALIAAALGILLAGDTGRRVFFAVAGLFARAPRIVPTMATLSFAFMLGGAPVLATMRTSELFDVKLWTWWPYGPQPGTGEDGLAALPEGTFKAPLYDDWSFALSGGARFHLYEVLAVVLAVVALALITFRFTRGRRGLDSRATAANLERAATLGVDVLTESKHPWQLAGALSGLAGILSVSMSATIPEVGLDIGALTLVLAAVVLARTVSPAWALVASLLLGVLDEAMFWSFGSQLPFQGSLVVIVGVALLLQRSRTSRAQRDAESVFTTAAEPQPVPRRIRSMPGVHGLLRGSLVLVAVVFIAYPLATTPRQLSLGLYVLATMVFGLSLLVLSGWGGQISLGQLALAAAGAYVTAMVGGVWGVPLPVAILLGALVAAVVAPLVGLPALRLPGPFVAIMTLAFGLSIPAVLLNVQLLGQYLPDRLTRPVILGVDLADDRAYYWFSLLVLAAVLGIVLGLRRSRLRRALIAAKDNALAAGALGVDVTRLRLEAFAVSGFVAGVGGGLLAYALEGVQPETFSAYNSIALFLIVIVGGLSAVSGPILGGALYSVFQVLGGAWLALFHGLGTIIVLASKPAGLAGIVVALRDAVIRVILHLQGTDQVRYAGKDGDRRVAIADRGKDADVVPVRYRMVGDGYGPVEGTRLREVAGADDTATPAPTRPAGELDDDPTDDLTAAPAAPAIACHRLDVAYGGTVALTGVSLSLAPGEVLAVVGLNGAGKTSLLRALAGLEPAAHGFVELGGQNVTNEFAYVRAAKGVAFVPGGAAVLGTLSVRENLVVAGADDDVIAELGRRIPALVDRLDTDAGDLSGGEQQLLAVAQAWARRPSVLLVDELSLGLSPEALTAVLQMVQELATDGTAVILVEQSISTAMSIADQALFLESGRVRYQGPAQALRDHPELFASVAFGAGGAVVDGGSELARARARQRLDQEPVLQVAGLSAAYGPVRVVDDVTFDVAPGEVVGILGPNGAGKTSLFDALSGILPVEDGTVTLLGEDVAGLAPHQRAQRGLMRSFQSVRLFPSLTVRDCIAVAFETRLKVKSPVYAGLWLPAARTEEARVDERVDGLLELLNLERVANEPVGSLSLGARRMVDLACQLAARPKVLLLDEPAAGLAQGETELLGPLVGRISSDLDCAVLIIEHNVQVLASVTHRLIAMRAGAVIAEGAPTDVLDDPAVKAAYFGSAVQEPPAAPQRELVGSH